MKGLELKGRVFQIMEPLSGESSKGPWTKREFIIETMDQYPKKICFTVWNDKVSDLAEGQVLTVFFNAESREYNGRWYTDLGCWKVDVDNEAAVNPVGSDTPPPAEVQEPSEDGLPF